MIARTLVRCVAGAFVLLGPEAGGAADSAAIFMYHHVAEDTPASTSVTPGRFRQQMAYLSEEGFEILPLLDVIAALRDGRRLPERTVALTFDDGYRSVLTEAVPELERRNWPFTVFITPGYIDAGYQGFLSWDQLREVVARGGTVGNHTLSHDHLVRRRPGETKSRWARRIREEFTAAGARIEAEIGAGAVPLVAYPYGEYDESVAAIVEELGMSALGQHSGAIGVRSDWLALPRYAVSQSLDSLTEFGIRARSRPLYLDMANPRATLNRAADGRPVLTARVSSPDVRKGQLACYASGQGRIELEWLEMSEGRFRTQPPRPFPPGRSRINCTAPARDESGVYHWFGMMWLTLLPDGRWYSD